MSIERCSLMNEQINKRIQISSIHRDTPHHLKNKRVQQGAIDKAAANILLAIAPKQLETVPVNTTINDNSIPESNHEQKSDHSNECGKLCLFVVIFTMPLRAFLSNYVTGTK